MTPAPQTRPAIVAAPLTGSQPRKPYVLILQDERGLVYIAAVENPVIQLHYMQLDGLQISDRRLAHPFTPHAERIVAALRDQFRDWQRIDLPGGCWFAAEWGAVHTALEDWNPSTGQLQRSGDFVIGNQVAVSADNTAVGEITAFRQEGPHRKARVSLAKPGLRMARVTYLQAWCPLGELTLLVHSTAPVAA